MQIQPAELNGTHRTGSLENVTKEEIVKALGFEPNVMDDPDKVENSWSFIVTRDGVQFAAAIWDYKGSHMFNRWSTFGPEWVFKKLFPGKVPYADR